ncbi:glycosyltransferase family 2 protein [Clostridium chrysemydis]|uniref:glycosyltransferase family 2 protein n=1 Tax=Clostridium chrysemydis TaxID=2665504 RepID=UPI0018844C0A|nr:glycosyltransferase [Clostridium chrysemydis]
MNPKISVIMGIYNCESTLKESIDSLFNQTFKDFELIMCDDGSSDSTYEIAKHYEKKHKDKVIVLKNKENMGLNYTLNKCLKEARGEYIARMDGDDISLPTRFEEEVQVLENEDVEIVSTLMSYFDKDGEWGKCCISEYPKKEELIKGTIFCHAPCMVKKFAYDKVLGYSVSDRLLRMEDYHLWMKMYKEGYSGKNIQKVLYKMRDDRDATNRRKFIFRLNESYVKRLIIKELKLKKINYIYTVKPIILGVIPKPIYEYLHKKKLNT